MREFREFYLPLYIRVLRTIKLSRLDIEEINGRGLCIFKWAFLFHHDPLFDTLEVLRGTVTRDCGS